MRQTSHFPLLDQENAVILKPGVYKYLEVPDQSNENSLREVSTGNLGGWTLERLIMFNYTIPRIP